MTLLVTLSAAARTRIVATGAGRQSDGRDDGGLATENRVEQIARIRIRRRIRRYDRLQERDRFVDATQCMQIDRERQRIARLQHVGRCHGDERVEIVRLKQHPHVAQPLEPQRCSDRCVIAVAESLRQLDRCPFRIAQERDRVGRAGSQRRQHIGIGWKRTVAPMLEQSAREQRKTWRCRRCSIDSPPRRHDVEIEKLIGPCIGIGDECIPSDQQRV